MLKHLTRVAGLALLVAALAAVLANHALAQGPTQGFRLGVRTFPVASGGVKIAEVAEHSPAKEVGLKAGQTILAIGGRLVRTNADVQLFLAAGATVDIIYIDGGQFYQITVPLVSTTFNYVTANGKTVQK